MKIISRKFKKSILSTSVLLSTFLILMSTLFLIGCNEDDLDEGLDETILNSSELEEYIIAGADLLKSLTAFENSLNKVDSSMLKVFFDAEGRRVVQYPNFVKNTRIEEKVQTFNETKMDLLKKFPRFASFKEKNGRKYLDQTIKNSVNVKGKLLKLGIDFSRPLLKGGVYEDWGFNECELQAFLLGETLNNPDYKEIYIIKYTDGTYSTWIDDKNTATKAHITLLDVKVDGEIVGHVFKGKYVAELGHTHKSGPEPSEADSTAKAENPLLNHFIWYDGGSHYF